MSSVVALVDRQTPADEREVPWSQFLESNLDVVWREGEWDPVTFTFTGDPASAMTGVNVCATPRCTTLRYLHGRGTATRRGPRGGHSLSGRPA